MRANLAHYLIDQRVTSEKRFFAIFQWHESHGIIISADGTRWGSGGFPPWPDGRAAASLMPGAASARRNLPFLGPKRGLGHKREINFFTRIKPEQPGITRIIVNVGLPAVAATLRAPPPRSRIRRSSRFNRLPLSLIAPILPLFKKKGWLPEPESQNPLAAITLSTTCKGQKKRGPPQFIRQNPSKPCYH
jgi:hypothetical protein